MMNAALSLLAVMLLTGPDEPRHFGAADYDEPVQKRKAARIASDASAFDRDEHVGAFEGNVVVTYGDDTRLSCDKLYVFLTASNRLARVVALGNVALTNDDKSCVAKSAVFHKLSNAIEIYGDAAAPARVRDGASEVAGTHMRYWIDSDEVDVMDANIEVTRPEGRSLK